MVEESPKSPSRFWTLLGLLAIQAAVVCWAHWPVLSAEATTFDDNQYLTENVLVQNPGWQSVRRFWSEVLAPSSVRGYYQPMAMTSLMLDYARGGRTDDLRAFHQTSLALHVANTVLLSVFLYGLFGQPWPAVLVGLLFGLHPIAVEPIAWVADRKTLLSTFFVLLCLNFYVGYAVKKKAVWYVLVALMYGLALLSKPTSLPLPVLLLLLDWWPLGRLSRRAIWEKVPLFVICAGAAVVTLMSQSRTAFVSPPQSASAGQLLLKLAHSVGYYLQAIFWPTDLSWHHPPPHIINFLQPMVLFGLAAAAAGVVIALSSWRSRKAFLACSLFFLVAISPTLGVVGFTNVSVANKFAYMPVVGIFVLLAWLLSALWQAFGARPHALDRKLTVFVLLVLVGALETRLARRYLGDWRDSEALYGKMIAQTPDAPLPRNNLAAVLLERGRVDDAIAEATKALELEPNLALAEGNLGNAYAALGHYDEALRHYRRARKLEPTSAITHNNLGGVYLKLDRLAAAVSELEQAILLKPDYPQAHKNLGLALLLQGSPEQAAAHLETANRLRRGDRQVHELLATAQEKLDDLNRALLEGAQFASTSGATAHYDLALLLAKAGEVDLAYEHYQAALRAEPDYAPAHNNLANLLAKSGRLAEAVKHYREATRLKPGVAEMHHNLAIVLRELGRSGEAIASLQQALRIDPGSFSAQLKLAEFFYQQGERDKAAVEFQRALQLDPTSAPARARLQALEAPAAQASPPE